MATEVQLKNLPQGYQTLITNGKHSIIGDEPVSMHGTDLGMTPTELVLAGLALCKVATVRFAARKRGWDIGNIDAKLSQEVKKGEGRALKTFIDVQLEIEGELDDKQRQTLLNSADRCYVHRMLQGEFEIGEAVESPSPTQ